VTSTELPTRERPAVETPGPSPEVLFEEARRRRRRRWAAGLSAVGVGVAAAAVAFGVSGSSAPRHPVHRAAARPPLSQGSGAVVTPKTPTTLTVGPGGVLYVVDIGRDQILRRLADGRFAVVAGSGKAGFSGDGGPAVDAKLRLGFDSGMAVTKTGALLFADSDNERVREVLPNGIIRTIAGGGTTPLGRSPVRAKAVSLGDPRSGSAQLAGLAVGPGASLYLALPAGVYKLAPDGILTHVVGGKWNPNQVLAWDKNPAGKGDFAPADRIAVDRAGDLFVAGGGGWGLYEHASTGKLRFVEVFRGDGAGFWGSLAADGEGTVIGIDNSGVQILSGSGHAKPLTDDPKQLQLALNRALGPRPKASGSDAGTYYFRGGYGIAAAPDGTIYVDQDSGIWSLDSGILGISPDGHVKTIWLSH
jgi:hypothetical protein